MKRSPLAKFRRKDHCRRKKATQTRSSPKIELKSPLPQESQGKDSCKFARSSGNKTAMMATAMTAGSSEREAQEHGCQSQDTVEAKNRRASLQYQSSSGSAGVSPASSRYPPLLSRRRGLGRGGPLRLELGVFRQGQPEERKDC